MLITFVQAYLEDRLAEVAVHRQGAAKVFRGSPKEWVKFLEKMGARYTGALKRGTQHLYDTRNLIVHGQGVATQDYVTNYAKECPSLRVGGRVPVGSAEFRQWLDNVGRFVVCTERLFS